MPDESKKSPSETFADMIKNFGSAMAEIFNDPKLKEKAKEFGESASDSAKAFAGRFKDEEVKDKFKEVGKAAKIFGESVSDYFKDDKEQSGNQASDSQPGTEQQEGSQDSTGEESKKKLVNSPECGQPVNDESKTQGPAAEKPKKRETDRNARIAGYSAAIAWSIILIVFFNFFNRYIAFYTYDTALKTWSMTPMLTGSFGAWLPIFNVSMIVAILGSIILIVNDSFYFNNITNIVINIFGISSVVTLLTLFPFDFTGYKDASLDPILFPIFKIVLAFIIVGLSIGILVRFIKIVIKIAKGA